jgi:hypothetical protein
MPQTQVQLPAATTFYSLVSLIRGAVSSSSPTAPYPNASPYCRSLTLQSDLSNGTAKIALIGSEVSSPTVAKGLQLNTGDSITLESDFNNVDLNSRGVVTDTVNAKLNMVWDVA